MRFLGRFDGIHQRLAVLEQRLSERQDALGAGQADAWSALASEIHALRQDIQASRTSLSEARADIAALPPILDATRADIAALPPILDATRADIAALPPVMASIAASLEGTPNDTKDAVIALAGKFDAVAQSLLHSSRILGQDHDVVEPPPAGPVKRLPLPTPAPGKVATTLKPSIYFIVGCGRSGTTSLARILDRADNGVCLSEPAPVLGLESRLLREGRLDEPFAALSGAIAPRVAEALDRGLIYGEKNLTLPPFIPHLHALFRCRFVHVIRDGRDVVRSWLDWHDHVYGNIYRECREPGTLSQRARKWVARYPAARDEYDASRPRPRPDDAWHGLWPRLRRLEMLAWHWSRTNDAITADLSQLPPEHWRRINYTGIDTTTMMAVADFLGLSGLDAATVSAMTAAKINKVEELAPDCVRFAAWDGWSDADKVAFDAIAAPTMLRLGYYPAGHHRHRPADFATAWRDGEDQEPDDLDWLVRQLGGARPARVRQVGGSNAATALPDAAIDTIAVGDWLEIDRQPTALALARHDALAGFYDIDAGIARLAAEATQYLFLSFAESGLAEHRHRRDPDTGRYQNDVSLAAVRAQLAVLGWRIEAEAVIAGRAMVLARPKEGRQ